MANPKVQVDIVAENVQLKAKLAETEALLAKQGQRASVGGKETAAAFDGATKSVGVFSKALRFIAFPAIIFETAKRISEAILDSAEHTRIWREEVRKVGDAYAEASRQAQLTTRQGSFGQQRAQQLKEELDAIGEAQKKLEEARAHQYAQEKAAAEEVRNAGFQDQKFAEDVLRRKLERIDKVEGADVRAAEEELKRITAAGRKRREAEDELTARQVRSRVLKSRATLAENDPELKARIELEDALQQVRIESAGQTNKKILDDYEELMANMELATMRSLKKISDAQNKQLREYIEEIKKAQTDGFLPKDVNVGALGAESTLAFFRNQLPAIVSFGSGGW